MKRITVTHQVEFISAETGFSAWVHVEKGTDDDFAHHCGYFDNIYSAKRRAEQSAKGIVQAFNMCGRKPKLIDGNKK